MTYVALPSTVGSSHKNEKLNNQKKENLERKMCQFRGRRPCSPLPHTSPQKNHYYKAGATSRLTSSQAAQRGLYSSA